MENIQTAPLLDVYRDGNNITISKMNHPGTVSNFLKAIRFGMRAGYSEFFLDFSAVNSAFPKGTVRLSYLKKARRC